jgi:hypothetical protein
MIPDGKEEETLKDCILFFKKKKIHKRLLELDKEISKAYENGDYEEQRRLEKERLGLINILKG